MTPGSAAPGASAADPDGLKVFVSYSRHDLAFADQLVAVLAWLRFEPIIDRQGIHGAERWQERLGQLILESDIVVFVLSPDSAESAVCHWEVDEALRRGKRIVPVLCRPLEGRQPHPRLRDLNYIHFHADPDVPGSGFGTGQVRLVEALSVDIGWLREHTRLEELAARWQRDGRPADQLLRGSELRASLGWRDRRPANAPELTVLQRTFLAASEAEEDVRSSEERRRLTDIARAQADRQAALDEREAAVRREAEARVAKARAQRMGRLVAIVAAGVVGAGLAAFSVQQYRVAQEQSRLKSQALTAQAEAVRQRDRAESQKKVVDELIRRLRVGQDQALGRSAMSKTCDEAVAVARELAGGAGGARRDRLRDRFYELFYGAMNVVEVWQRTARYTGDTEAIADSPIEFAMVRFANDLRGGAPPAALTARADAIRAACDAYFGR